ncbi:MAG: heme exporter protein CcmD [Rhodospirillaceae bacterium]|nr:heme exporter protein CcmD [Rhodospirillaceae bacterium]
MAEVEAFLGMEGYGSFIWAAYLLATLILVGLLAQSRRVLRKREALLLRLRSMRRGNSDD